MRAVNKMIPLYVLSLAVVFACAVFASRSVTVLSAVMAPAEMPLLPTVVLDPGHGGEDGGAVSPDGLKESTLNLEISLRARDLLRFLGLSVVMTRETDVSIYSPDAATVSEKKVSDLKNRVRLVGEIENAVLLSIHQNKFSESKYKGAQVFYAPTTGSKELAERLQSVFDSQVDPSNHRLAKQSQSVYLLNKIHCPGVIVECGFLSNPEETKQLQTNEYQKLLVTAICAGLTLFLEACAVPGIT